MKDILPISSKTEITIIEVLYYEPYRDKNIYKDDVLMVVYKVGESNEKHIEVITRPEIEYYVVKEEHRTFNTPREYLHESMLETRRCKSTGVVRDIIEVIKEDKGKIGKDFRAFISSCYESDNKRALKEVHKYPYVLFSDSKVKDYYRIMMANEYNCDRRHNFRKSFMDIEQDIYKLSAYDRDVLHKDKINAITVIFDFDPRDEKSDKRSVHTLLLRDHERYPQQADFEKRLPEFKKECHKLFDSIPLVRKKSKVDFKMNAEFHIKLFDSEIELLKYYFKLMNAANPDTCEIWNIGYDIPKIIERLRVLGASPEDVMSHPKFPKAIRYVRAVVDNRGNITAADKKTYIEGTFNYRHICQMNNYAAMNKGLKDYGDNSLDNVAGVEIGWSKFKFRDKRTNVINAAVRDYWDFALYSIQDVIAQLIISFYTKHSDDLMSDANASASAPENVTKATQYLKNLYYLFRLRKGFVSGNNRNQDYIGDMTDAKMEELLLMKEYALEKAKERKLYSEDGDDSEDTADSVDLDDDEALAVFSILNKNGVNMVDSPEMKHKLKGGIVGNPHLNYPNGVLTFNAVRSKHIYDYCIDQDYASEYPNAEITRNISMSTEFGRLVIPMVISSRQNVYCDPKYIPGGEYLSDLISGDFVSLGNVYHGLPTSEELIKEFIKEFGNEIGEVA